MCRGRALDILRSNFRSLRSTTVTQRRRARAFAQYVHQLVTALEARVLLPDHTIKPHPIAPDSTDWEEIERAASATRSAWGVHPTEPIPHVVRLLERHGIVVVRSYDVAPKVDAFSVPFPDRSLIVLSAEKMKHDRSRFDASHEVGHLVMHRDLPEEARGTKHVESQAHRFAGAFLMPADGIIDELPTSHRDVRSLLDLKAKWGASIGALLRRARDLGRMTADGYVSAMKALSARGWRTDEPSVGLAPEEPLLLRRAIEVANQGGLSIADLAEMASLPEAFVQDVLAHSTDPRPRLAL